MRSLIVFALVLTLADVSAGDPDRDARARAALGVQPVGERDRNARAALMLACPLPTEVRAVAPMPRQVKHGKIEWITNYNDGMAAAEKKGTPIMTLVTSPETCPACRQLESGALAAEQVQAEVRRFTPILVNAGDDLDMPKRLGVRVVPTILIATPDGKIIDKIEGNISAAELSRRLADPRVAGDK